MHGQQNIKICFCSLFCVSVSEETDNPVPKM